MDVTKKRNFVFIVLIYVFLVVLNIWIRSDSLVWLALAVVALFSFLIKKKNVLPINGQRLIFRMLPFLFGGVFIVDVVWIVYSVGKGENIHSLSLAILPVWFMYQSLFYVVEQP